MSCGDFIEALKVSRVETPYYVFNQHELLSNINKLRAAADSAGSKLLYSLKACACKGVLEAIQLPGKKRWWPFGKKPLERLGEANIGDDRGGLDHLALVGDYPCDPVSAGKDLRNLGSILEPTAILLNGGGQGSGNNPHAAHGIVGPPRYDLLEQGCHEEK